MPISQYAKRRELPNSNLFVRNDTAGQSVQATFTIIGTTSGPDLLVGTRSGTNVFSVNANGRLIANASQAVTSGATLSTNSIVLAGSYAQALNLAQNVGTGETDLHSFTITANTLANDGDYLEIEATGVLAATGNTKTIRFYFAGTLLVASTTTGNDASWLFKAKIIRMSSTVVRVTLRIVVEGNGSIAPLSDIVRTNISFASTFTIDNIFKVTGQSSASSNDVNQDLTVIKKYSAI